MPSFATHKRFIQSYPYRAWYLITVNKHYVGTVYLTRRDEIGIFIFRSLRGEGFGPTAIRLLMDKHPRKRFLANINPRNGSSVLLFRRLGFTHIQNTYAYEPN